MLTSIVDETSKCRVYAKHTEMLAIFQICYNKQEHKIMKNKLEKNEIEVELFLSILIKMRMYLYLHEVACSIFN